MNQSYLLDTKPTESDSTTGPKASAKLNLPVSTFGDMAAATTQTNQIGQKLRVLTTRPRNPMRWGNAFLTSEGQCKGLRLLAILQSQIDIINIVFPIELRHTPTFFDDFPFRRGLSIETASFVSAPSAFHHIC